jgi:hypothetical protein
MEALEQKSKVVPTTIPGHGGEHLGQSDEVGQ